MRLTVVLVLLTHLLSTPVGAAESKTIAFAQDTMANDFRRAQVYEVRDALADLPHIRFIYTDAKAQTSLLIRQIEQLIRQGIDLLILGTNDPSAVVPVVSKAYQQGIPVIVLDRGIEGENYTTFIHSDNLEIGRLGAEFIAQRLGGKGKVLLFEGLPKADVTQLRTRGFLEAMADYPHIHITRRIGNYLRRDAILETERLMAEGHRFDGVFSESDSMLSGARLVWEKHGLDPASLITVGCDYTSEARKAIIEGSQTASVLFPLGGREAAEAAVKILAGETLPKHVQIPVRLISAAEAPHTKPIF